MEIPQQSDTDELIHWFDFEPCFVDFLFPLGVEVENRFVFANKSYIRTLGYFDFEEIKSIFCRPETKKVKYQSRKIAGAPCEEAEYLVIDNRNRSNLVRKFSTNIMYEGVPATFSTVRNITGETDQIKFIDDMTKRSTYGELLAGFVHELAQPILLAEVTTHKIVENLKEGAEIDKKNEVSVMQECLYDIERIVQSFEQIEAGFVTAKENSVFASDLIKEIASRYSKLAETKQIALDVQIDKNSSEFKIDSIAGSNILTNLILNSFDAIGEKMASDEYSLTSSTTEKISVSLKQLKPRLFEIAVADSGGGIPETLIRSIFLPFFSTKQGKGGSGLGLDVVYKSVEKIGGSISVENIGRGACFRILIPSSI